jgi:hypothetical protein
MAQITINEGLAWLKTLKKRHEELLALRNDNAHRERRFYGASADKEIVKEPVYDVKVLDRLVTRVAREIRLLEQALKVANAKTTIEGYETVGQRRRVSADAMCNPRWLFHLAADFWLSPPE